MHSLVIRTYVCLCRACTLTLGLISVYFAVESTDRLVRLMLPVAFGILLSLPASHPTGWGANGGIAIFSSRSHPTYLYRPSTKLRIRASDPPGPVILAPTFSNLLETFHLVMALGSYIFVWTLVPIHAQSVAQAWVTQGWPLVFLSSYFLPFASYRLHLGRYPVFAGQPPTLQVERRSPGSRQ